MNPGLPRLVTAPWLQVPIGTNGGMSLYGTLASLFGGMFIGVGFALLGLLYDRDEFQIGLVYIGCIGGLGGSLIDSILGATIQVSYYNQDKKLIVNSSDYRSDPVNVKRICGLDILNGEQVNFLSVILTTIACGVGGRLFI